MRDTLEERQTVRFFRGDRKKRREYLRAFPGRWENDNHFIRSAVLYFERILDREVIAKKIQRKVRR